ncbi:MAG: hypothetical protein U9O64_01820 [Campylobacterota bacterium]|nr:hypothetical protein [Campylobacterota bacterium]
MSNYQFTVKDALNLSTHIRRFGRTTFIIIAVGIAFLFLPWEQTIKGKGTLIAYDPTERPYTFLATIDGFIKKFHVTEDQYVKEGTALFEMVDLDDKYIQKLHTITSNIESQIVNTEETIRLTQEKYNNTKEYLEVGLNVYDQKLSQSKDKIRSLKLKKVSLEKNSAVETLQFQRIKHLFNEGIQSKRVYESAENTKVTANAELEKNSVDITIEMKNIDIIKNEKEKFLNDTNNKLKSLESLILTSKNRSSSLKEKLQLQSMNISRYKTSKAYAAKDGYVVRMYQNDTNKLIKKGEKILFFSPDVSVRTLLLKVSDFNMPLMRAGNKVRIMFYGWPAMQVPGWPEIKFGTFGGIVKRVDPISHESGFHYAYIIEDPNDPWPSHELLKLGTRANAWVRLETVSLWYQLWRLMNALPPQMGRQQAGLEE